jgi:hypothetical protein
MKVWDIKQLAVIFGIIPVSDIGGYGEDDSISFKQSEDSFMTKVGADGQVTRYATNASLAEIEITTMQTSSLNALLSGILLTDTSTPGGAGIMPFSAADLQGTTLLTCSSCWVCGPPECPFGKSAKERKWKLQGVISSPFVGGN